MIQKGDKYQCKVLCNYFGTVYYVGKYYKVTDVRVNDGTDIVTISGDERAGECAFKSIRTSNSFNPYFYNFFYTREEDRKFKLKSIEKYSNEHN